MKSKLYNLLLILSSLIGYLEWSGNSHTFLFQAEFELISKLFTNPASVLHPFTIVPLAGQVLLLITLFQKTPNRAWTFIGAGCIGLLLAFMFVIGVISFNYKILLSTIPFLILAVLTIRHYRKRK